MATWPGGNSFASAYWNRLNGSYTIGGWTGGYNGLSYDPVLNPLGMDNNGHRYNLIPSFNDIASIAADMASYAATAAAAANTTTAWANPFSGFTRISNNSFSVTGNQVAIFMPNGIAGRAVAGSTSTTLANFACWMHVASAVYTAITTVTTTESTLTSGLGILSIWLGQDPTNDPLSGTLMTGCNYNTAGGQGIVPAPAAAQENSILCGDAVYHDPATLLQIWG